MCPGVGASTQILTINRRVGPHCWARGPCVHYFSFRDPAPWAQGVCRWTLGLFAGVGAMANSWAIGAYAPRGQASPPRSSLAFHTIQLYNPHGRPGRHWKYLAQKGGAETARAARVANGAARQQRCEGLLLREGGGSKYVLEKLVQSIIRYAPFNAVEDIMISHSPISRLDRMRADWEISGSRLALEFDSCSCARACILHFGGCLQWIWICLRN